MPDAPPIQLPPLRNIDPRRIDAHGFVECPTLLPQDVCDEIAKLSMTAAEQISNASELDLAVASTDLAQIVESILCSSSTLREAVEHFFSTPDFCVPVLKVLETKHGAEPQIPHADDYWNRELFGVLQVRSGQQPTQAVVYDSSAAYPTGIWKACATCGSYISIPDHIARKREHLKSSPFQCSLLGSTCERKRTLPTSRAEAHAEREQIDAEHMRDAFSQLLFRAAETVSCMRPIGTPNPEVGDAIVGLPTLVHRGPGGYSIRERTPMRRVLFFVIEPRFSDKPTEVASYDPDKQVHAAWLLWYCSEAVDDLTRDRICATYKRLGHNLGDFA